MSTKLGFTSGFARGELRGRCRFELEISEPPGNKIGAGSFSSGLWSRVERLYHIARAYTDSDFAKQMGKSYIRPPVMRTNAILKNKHLRQCLALWEFIESYDKTGYEMLVQETAESPSEELINEIYANLALQYMIFRQTVENQPDTENALAVARRPRCSRRGLYRS